MAAAAELSTKVGFAVAAFLVIIEIECIGGAKKLTPTAPVHSFWKV